MSFVLAITGPAGSGKSTVSTKLAKQLPKCVNIEADHVKHMIVSGFYKDDENPGGWSFSEWELVGDSIGLLAANFQQKGFDIIINGYIDEPGWSAIEKHVALTNKILLLPHVDTTKSRDKQRPGDEPMGEEAVQEHHNHFSNDNFYKDFAKVDSSEHSVDETISQILKLTGITR